MIIFSHGFFFFSESLSLSKEVHVLYLLNFSKFLTLKKIPEVGDELTITLAIINQSTFSLSRLKSSSISDVCLEVKDRKY